MDREEKLVVFGEEFIIKDSMVRPGYTSGWHAGEQITKSRKDKFEVLREIVIVYEDNFMLIEEYIENLNLGSKMWVNDDPENRYTTSFPEDINYWNKKGIETVFQLRNYLGAGAENNVFNVGKRGEKK